MQSQFQSVGCTPRAQTAAPCGGKQTISSLEELKFRASGSQSGTL
jgi:hypothetical protein